MARLRWGLSGHAGSAPRATLHRLPPPDSRNCILEQATVLLAAGLSVAALLESVARDLDAGAGSEIVASVLRGAQDDMKLTIDRRHA